MIAYWFAKLADALEEEIAALRPAPKDWSRLAGSFRETARHTATVRATLTTIVRALRKVGGQ